MSVTYFDLMKLPEWTNVEMSPAVNAACSIMDVELILTPRHDYKSGVLYCLPWQSSLYDPAIDATIRRLARDHAAGILLVRGDGIDHEATQGMPRHLAELADRLYVNMGSCDTSAFSIVWTAIKQRLASTEFSRLQQLNVLLEKLRRFASTCISVEEFVSFAGDQLGVRILWGSQQSKVGASHPVRIANETIGYLICERSGYLVQHPLLGVVGELAAAIHLADVSRLQVKSHFDSDLLRILLDDGIDRDALTGTFRRARLNPDASTRVAVLTMRYGVAQEGRIRFWDPIFLALEQSFEHRSLRLLTGYVSGYPTILLQDAVTAENAKSVLVGDDVATIIRNVMGDDIIMGLSAAVPLRVGCSGLFQEAVESVTIGRALDRSDAIVRYEALGEDRVFYMLLTSPFAMQLARNMLYSLVKMDSEQGTDYVETVSAYVLNDRKVSETAKILNLHRNSLRYRLSNIEQILGFTFADTERVLLLQLAVLSHRLQGDKLTVESMGTDT